MNNKYHSAPLRKVRRDCGVPGTHLAANAVDQILAVRVTVVVADPRSSTALEPFLHVRHKLRDPHAGIMLVQAFLVNTKKSKQLAAFRVDRGLGADAELFSPSQI